MTLRTARSHPPPRRPRRRRGVACWAAILLLAAPGCTRPTPRHVVVILVDTLRADRLGCYGYRRPTSPAIDRLAEESVLFENAFSSSAWTAPAVASLFTSLYPSEHGVTTFQRVLPKSARTLAEVLVAQGFRATALSANFAAAGTRNGVARGFDPFVEVAPEAGQRARTTLEEMKAADAVAMTDRATAALQDAFAARTFFYVHYMDPHSPYDPPEPYRGSFLHPYAGPISGAEAQLVELSVEPGKLGAADWQRIDDLYDGTVAFADAEIGRLLGELRRRGILDESIVVLVADHGEEIGDHGGIGHGQALYDEVRRVPLLVRLPGGRHGGERVKTAFPMVDLGPTLLGLLEVRDDRAVSGRDRGSLLAGADADDPEGGAFSELFEIWPPTILSPPIRHSRALATRDWSYLVGVSGNEELYHRSTDPGEKENRIARDAAEADRLRGRAATFAGRAAAHAARDVGRIEIGPEDRQRLMALGYLR